MTNFLSPQPTLIPEPDIASGSDLSSLHANAQTYPSVPRVWADLAEDAVHRSDWITAYAFARTGYHRGLDLLRKNGWKGFGSVPYSHIGNRGWLRSVAALAQSAQAIGEIEEYHRLVDLLVESDATPEAADALGWSQWER